MATKKSIPIICQRTRLAFFYVFFRRKSAQDDYYGVFLPQILTYDFCTTLIILPKDPISAFAMLRYLFPPLFSRLVLVADVWVLRGVDV
jgi:hypothetical protein